MTSTTIGGMDLVPSADREDYLTAVIHGRQGTGKTYLASTIAQQGKTLFVDMVSEHGLRAFSGADWEDDIDVVRPDTVQQLDDLYWDLAKGGHGYTAVVLDSLTAVQNTAIRFLTGRSETTAAEITKGGPSMRIQDWGDLRDIISDVATFWMGLANADRDEPMHVVMTSQSRENESEEDGLFQTLELSRGSRSFALSTPDYVIFTAVEDDFDNMDKDGEPGRRFIARLLTTRAATKARIPVDLHGKIPHTLGRGEQPLSLVTLGKVMRVGGLT